MGRYIQALSKVKINVCFMSSITVFYTIVSCFMGDGSFGENLFNTIINNQGRYYLALTFLIGIGGSFMSLFFYSAYKAYAGTACKLAEEIFQVFGWRNPKWINLKKITATREKELMRQGKWYSPNDTSKPPLPSAKFLWDEEYWHYY